MLLKLFSLIAIAIGILLLVYSLRPACNICRNDKAWGWKVLAVLVLAFVGGYAFFLIRTIFLPVIDNATLILSLILLGGAIFVALIIPLSLNSILSFNRIAIDERHQSLHDNLTGLPNRKFFIEELRSHVSKRNPFIVLLIDLNNFKEINDGLGHYLGDKFLIAVASQLQSTLQSIGTVFRLGGDEFAVIVPNQTIENIEVVTNRVHHMFKSPMTVMTYSMKMSASIGISHFPSSSEDVFGLIKQADLAMYESKTLSKPFIVYHPELGLASYERLKLSLKLSEAIRHQEFQLYYQPIISGLDKSLASFEVLIRWPQKNGSMISPDKFIPIAERSTLMGQLTQWVIQQSCHDLKQLRAKGFKGALHINLSAKDLQTNEIETLLTSLLENKALQPGDFLFEVTEGAMLHDLEQARQIMASINKLGFHFSIDDFGTGFSSFIILRELPIREIKIDRSFVSSIQNNEASKSIVNSILRLGRELECQVVAEGVETSGIEAILIQQGCDYLQGYHYAKPQPLHGVVYQYFEDKDKPELIPV